MKAVLVIVLLLAMIGIVVSCQSEQQLDFARYYSSGADVYQKHCQNCHGDQGQGLAALIPPLTDPVYLKVNKSQQACWLQNGLKGKLNIRQKQFDGEMPVANLSSIEIAQVLTYVNNSFGNKSGLINNDDVEKDLKGCK